MERFDDKIALVTGASRGLGFALAEALGAAGAQVAALARTVGGLEELDDAIAEAGGPKPVLIPQDLTEEAGVEGLGPALASRFGRLDLWIHTAHFSPPVSPVAHMDIRDLDRAWAVDVRPLPGLIRGIEPLLRQAPAPMAMFFDDPSLAGRMHHGAVQAAAAARAALVADWAAASRTAGIAVVTVAPPPMRTASRGRLYPGERTETLAEPRAVAREILARLPDGTGRLDLSGPAPGTA